jgi:hypothetical protein
MRTCPLRSELTQGGAYGFTPVLDLSLGAIDYHDQAGLHGSIAFGSKRQPPPLVTARVP